MEVGSIPVAILPSCQYKKLLHLKCIDMNKVGSKNKKHLRGHNTPLGHHTNCGPTGLGQYYNLGEYCGPHTASSVFLLIISSPPPPPPRVLNDRSLRTLMRVLVPREWGHLDPDQGGLHLCTSLSTPTFAAFPLKVALCGEPLIAVRGVRPHARRTGRTHGMC